MNVSESIEYLLSLQSAGIKLGLDNMRRLCAELGHPERGLRFLHIAGTNGKGSVAAMLESILRSAGYRTGLYTSPHLVDFGERIRVCGLALDPAELAERTSSLRPVIEKLAGEGIRITFFEATTALAFGVFRDAAPDWVVLETGLGGRLDSTNVVDPVITAITGIGLDHMEFLGTTLGEIAGEKAGIAKTGCPLVLGQVPDEARSVIIRRCAEISAPVVESGNGCPTHWNALLGRQAMRWGGDSFEIGLAGRHQAANAAVVLSMVDLLRGLGHKISKSAVEQGLAGVVWPARFEILRTSPPLVLDGGHNPDGMAMALEVWRECFGHDPGRVIFGCMRDKATAKMVSILDRAELSILLVPVSSPRSAEPGILAEQFRRTRPRSCATLEEARRIDMSEPHPRGTLVLGSLYLAGEWKALSGSRGHQLELNG